MKGTTLAPKREQREMTVTQRRPYPHTAVGRGPAPPRTGRRASVPEHSNHHLVGAGKKVQGMGRQQGRFRWTLTKATKRKNQRQVGKEREIENLLVIQV